MSKATDAPVSGWKKPGRLQAGATVGLIAPASPVSEEKTAKALANLAAQGFRVKEGAAMRARHGYLAGDDNARLAEAIAAEHVYGPRVSAAIDASHQSMGALQKATLEHVFAMRSILRPEQHARFDAAIDRALTVETR